MSHMLDGMIFYILTNYSEMLILLPVVWFLQNGTPRTSSSMIMFLGGAVRIRKERSLSLPCQGFISLFLRKEDNQDKTKSTCTARHVKSETFMQEYTMFGETYPLLNLHSNNYQ